MKTFPKPLNAMEEKYYLSEYKEGNNEARKILIERNLRLVAHVAKKYQFVDEEIEDMISIGTIGLIKAISTFDCTKGIKLATYAARCIDNELLMFLRNKKKTSKDVSLYEPIGTDKEGNEISLLDIVEKEEEDIVENYETNINIQKMFELIDKVLTPREKYIIVKRYGLRNNKEVTQREIANQLKISRSYVSRIEKKALKKLRDSFNMEKI